MYWEHKSKVVTRWNLEYAKGQPKEVKGRGFWGAHWRDLGNMQFFA